MDSIGMKNSGYNNVGFEVNNADDLKDRLKQV